MKLKVFLIGMALGIIGMYLILPSTPKPNLEPEYCKVGTFESLKHYAENTPPGTYYIEMGQGKVLVTEKCK